jgi:hypothetical protein
MTEAAAAFSFDGTKIWGRVELLCALNGLQDSSKRCGRVEILRKLLLIGNGAHSSAGSEMWRSSVLPRTTTWNTAGGCEASDTTPYKCCCLNFGSWHLRHCRIGVRNAFERSIEIEGLIGLHTTLQRRNVEPTCWMLSRNAQKQAVLQ